MTSGSDAEVGRYHALGSPASGSFVSVLSTAGPLLLAIAGSALTPLPCAFSMVGIPGGLLLVAVIAAANDYTTIIMVKAAAATGVTGYEEVVHATCGRRWLHACRIALVVLLFGTLCGSLAAMRETAARTFELVGFPWISSTGIGRALLLAIIACGVLPLSLASLGEMMIVSLVGVGLMISIATYVLFRAGAAGSFRHLGSDSYLELRPTLLPQASSIFGYAFYVQPCALPMLRTLPEGDAGRKVLEKALHFTFAVTSLAYGSVGLGGFLLYGRATPEDLLTSCTGSTGALLTGIFCVYLMLCFAPMLVPLREALVRLYLAQHGENELLVDVQLPPRENALLTASIVAAALFVTLMLPQSEMLFAITGATGVCLIGYVFPVLAYWSLLKGSRGTTKGGSAEIADVWTYASMIIVVSIGVAVSVFSLVTIVSGLISAEEPFCAA